MSNQRFHCIKFTSPKWRGSIPLVVEDEGRDESSTAICTSTRGRGTPFYNNKRHDIILHNYTIIILPLKCSAHLYYVQSTEYCMQQDNPTTYVQSFGLRNGHKFISFQIDISTAFFSYLLNEVHQPQFYFQPISIPHPTPSNKKLTFWMYKPGK